MSKKLFVVLGVLVAGALVLEARSFRVANNFPTDQYFQIKPKGSRYCLGLKDGQRYKEVALEICSDPGTKWKFVKRGNGIYELRNKRGGYLGIKNIRKNKSKAVHVPSGRRVKFLAKNGSTYHIKINVGGKVLDVAGNTRKRGTKVIQYPYHGRGNQQWVVVNAKTRRYFNYQTYRAPRNDNDRGPAGNSGSLQVAMNSDYQLERYFKTCSYNQLRGDTRNNYLENSLNDLKMSKRIIKVLKIVKGARQNSNSSVRSMTYRTLLNVNLKGGGFVEKMAKGQIRKEVNNALRTETRPGNKNYLRDLLGNLR